MYLSTSHQWKLIDGTVTNWPVLIDYNEQRERDKIINQQHTDEMQISRVNEYFCKDVNSYFSVIHMKIWIFTSQIITWTFSFKSCPFQIVFLEQTSHISGGNVTGVLPFLCQFKTPIIIP